MRTEDVITRLFRAVDREDWEHVAAALHPHIIYERPGFAPFRGVSEVMNFYTTRRRVKRGQHVIDGILSDELRASCWGSLIGVGPEDEAICERFADIYCFEEGRIRHRRTHFFRPAI